MKALLEITFAGTCLLALLSLAAGAGYPAAVEFQLRDAEGKLHSAAEWKGHSSVVLFFVTTDCPLSNGYVPEMNRIRSY